MKWTDTGNKMQISISDERIGLPVSKHGLIGTHRVVREGSIWLTLVNTRPEDSEPVDQKR